MSPYSNHMVAQAIPPISMEMDISAELCFCIQSLYKCNNTAFATKIFDICIGICKFGTEICLENLGYILPRMS